MVTGTLKVLAEAVSFSCGLPSGSFPTYSANLVLGAAVESIDVALVAEIEIVCIRGRAMISGCPGLSPITVAQGNQRGEADIKTVVPEVQSPLEAIFFGRQCVGGLQNRRRRYISRAIGMQRLQVGGSRRNRSRHDQRMGLSGDGSRGNRANDRPDAKNIGLQRWRETVVCRGRDVCPGLKSQSLRARNPTSAYKYSSRDFLPHWCKTSASLRCR